MSNKSLILLLLRCNLACSSSVSHWLILRGLASITDAKQYAIYAYSNEFNQTLILKTLTTHYKGTITCKPTRMSVVTISATVLHCIYRSIQVCQLREPKASFFSDRQSKYYIKEKIHFIKNDTHMGTIHGLYSTIVFDI